MDHNSDADAMDNLLKRLKEIGYEKLKEELLSNSSSVGNDFKQLTDKVKQYYMEEQQEEYVVSGKPVFISILKL